jgi:hypothetical protein
MENPAAYWILFAVMVASTLYNIWKSGFSVNKELNKKVDKTDHDKDISDLKSSHSRDIEAIKSSLDSKVEEDDLKAMRESILGTVDRTNELAQLELKFLKADLKKHENDHTMLNKNIKDMSDNIQSMAVNMAVYASQMKAINERK